VRHHFGIRAFGANTWTGHNAGDRIINEHDESQDEPGHQRADETPYDAEEEVPSAVKRTAFAEEPGTTIVAVGGIPGKAQEPIGWEVWRPFHPLYESGKFAEVADRGRAVIEMSGYSEPLYNLACCESLAGRPPEAIEHLRLALERSNQYRERLRSLAAEDSDFDPIREEPAFKELVR
jgi:hypothetical protein